MKLVDQNSLPSVDAVTAGFQASDFMLLPAPKPKSKGFRHTSNSLETARPCRHIPPSTSSNFLPTDIVSQPPFDTTPIYPADDFRLPPPPIRRPINPFPGAF
jgi:hypothetical protein